jgi:hypothetical protein
MVVSVIPATHVVGGSPGKSSRPYLEKKKKKRKTRDMTQVGEHLTSKKRP